MHRSLLFIALPRPQTYTGSYPFRALIRKSCTVQKRQKKTLCCQVCMPVTLLLIIFGFQLTLNLLLEDQAWRSLRWLVMMGGMFRVIKRGGGRERLP